jgi:hypothetical protein
MGCKGERKKYQLNNSSYQLKLRFHPQQKIIIKQADRWMNQHHQAQ